METQRTAGAGDCPGIKEIFCLDNYLNCLLNKTDTHTKMFSDIFPDQLKGAVAEALDFQSP
jgi:hypothetical protein